MTKEQEEQEEFRVTDKRSFNEEGEVRNSGIQDDSKQQPSEKPSPKDTKKNLSGEEERQIPPIDFPSYLLSYYTQGLVLLGEVPNPYTNKKEEDTEAARHTIDILTLLEEKTKGNLSQDEQKLLENVLYELRMKYMTKTNRIKI
jgi:hypothetical protein